jgi:hypothetical protein
MCDDKVEGDIVYISKTRLNELEALEAKLPLLIDEAIKEYKTYSLKRLHEKDKMNPKAVAERARRYVEKNRERLNERRRQNRKLKLEKKEDTSTVIELKPPAPRITYSRTDTTCLKFD